MKLELFVLCTLGILAGIVGAQYESEFTRDINGDLHVVNQNPFTVIDAHLERAFTAVTDVFFRLHTRKNPEEAQILKANEAFPVNRTNFNPKHQTRFLVHGWLQDGNSEMQRLLRKNYLAIGDFNVLSVDWGEGAQTINYFTARYRVGSVGLVISQMIDSLVKAVGVALDSINIIGHSLGAHIAGVAGKHQNGRIHSIVGLDPARIWFTTDAKDLLRQNDAQYVEAMFTSHLGFRTPLGVANFYPNGGVHQPGCGLNLLYKCAHSRSWMYFAESLTSQIGFRATRCNSHGDVTAGSCVLESSATDTKMGGEPSNHGKGVTGVYLVVTNSEEPYAKG